MLQKTIETMDKTIDKRIKEFAEKIENIDIIMKLEHQKSKFLLSIFTKNNLEGLAEFIEKG